ncbi:MAG TPA: MerR family transcriptional regulator [Acidimicrobiales bacterium]|nr:MerR family transcriptional regulator [Acidimicrobiales bacterium]
MSGERKVAHTQTTYVISVAAERAGVHPQTLRIYERKGLLDPGRTPGGSRRYSDEDIAQMAHIQELTGQGINLEGVRRILALEAQIEKAREQLDDALELARQAVEATHRQYRRELVPLRTGLLPARRWK